MVVTVFVEHDADLLACGACGMDKYCSKKCQREHWPMHRKVCKALNPKPAAVNKEREENDDEEREQRDEEDEDAKKSPVGEIQEAD